MKKLVVLIALLSGSHSFACDDDEQFFVTQPTFVAPGQFQQAPAILSDEQEEEEIYTPSIEDNSFRIKFDDKIVKMEHIKIRLQSGKMIMAPVINDCLPFLDKRTNCLVYDKNTRFGGKEKLAYNSRGYLQYSGTAIPTFLASASGK